MFIELIMIKTQEYQGIDQAISSLSELVGSAKKEIRYVGREIIFSEFVDGRLRDPLVHSFESWKSSVESRLKRRQIIAAKSEILAQICQPFLGIHSGILYNLELQTTPDVIEKYKNQLVEIKKIVPPLEVYSIENTPNSNICFIDDPYTWMWSERKNSAIKCKSTYVRFSVEAVCVDDELGNVELVNLE